MGPPFNNEELKMAQDVEVKRTCAQCQGTGTYKGGPDSPVSCPWPGCNGTGEYVVGHIYLDPGIDDLRDDIVDLKAEHADLMEKLNDILEAIQNP